MHQRWLSFAVLATEAILDIRYVPDIYVPDILVVCKGQMPASRTLVL